MVYNDRIKKIIIWISMVIILLNLTGCHLNYRTQTKAIDNIYFQSEVVWEDRECTIIRNKVTGEYFILTCGAYGVSLCPIEVSEIDSKDFLVSGSK